jgi:antitoxin VapB
MTNSALNIKNAETVRLARELAAKSGETITQAVTTALRERLETLERTGTRPGIERRVRRIQDFVALLPELDDRTSEEILGYDDHGLPT